MPFPDIIMQNRPFRTPIWALFIHLGITILFICAPPAGDAFEFVVSLNSYPTVLLLTAVTIGLIKLRMSKDEDARSGFIVPWAVLAVYLVGNIVSIFLLL
jgi:amino acid transporter